MFSIKNGSLTGFSAPKFSREEGTYFTELMIFDEYGNNVLDNCNILLGRFVINSNYVLREMIGKYENVIGATGTSNVNSKYPYFKKPIKLLYMESTPIAITSYNMDEFIDLADMDVVIKGKDEFINYYKLRKLKEIEEQIKTIDEKKLNLLSEAKKYI